MNLPRWEVLTPDSLYRSIEDRPTRYVLERLMRSIRGEAPADPGYVYMMRGMDFCKIGKASEMFRREREIKLQLPFPVRLVHWQPTCNMRALEAFWHAYFRHKRLNGEWFTLSGEDVLFFLRYNEAGEIDPEEQEWDKETEDETARDQACEWIN